MNGSPWRGLCLLLAGGALALTAALWLTDGQARWAFTAAHQRIGSGALILIGGAYIALQWGARRRRVEAVKGVLLGAAFVLWGLEQFLRPGPWVTVIDGLVITLFVLDLSLVIFGRLRSKE